MCLAYAWGWHDVGLLFLLMFACMLRPQEATSVEKLRPTLKVRGALCMFVDQLVIDITLYRLPMQSSDTSLT